MTKVAVDVAVDDPSVDVEVTVHPKGNKSFILYVWTANFGRGVSVAEFKRNAHLVMDNDHDASCAFGIQELDELDKPNEHQEVRELSEGDHLVGWGTLEPIVVSGRYRARNPRVKPTSKGVPELSPARTVVSCCVDLKSKPEVPMVAVLNNHAPRKTSALKKQIADNKEGMREEVTRQWQLKRSYIWTGDMNDARFPRMTPGEKTAVHARLDYIRYRSHPKGAQLELLDTGTVKMSIDGHDAHWAKFKVTAP